METARFYVYELADPETGEAFYVGKGQGYRAYQHVAGVKAGWKGRNKAKESRISEILSAGREPVVRILYRFADEQDALDTEADLIASTPGLTNIMAGGGKAMTADEATRRIVARAKSAEAAEFSRTVNYLRKFVLKSKGWGGVTFPSFQDGDALAEEFITRLECLLSEVETFGF